MRGDGWGEKGDKTCGKRLFLDAKPRLSANPEQNAGSGHSASLSKEHSPLGAPGSSAMPGFGGGWSGGGGGDE